MRLQRAVLTLAAAAACALAGCGDDRHEAATTAVMGGSASRPAPDGQSPITDAAGRTIPPPRVPPKATAHLAPAGQESALAIWIQDGDPVASTYARGTGWSAPQPLEQLHGQASDPRVVANATGAGMAVWRHTVGLIQSLRFSRYDPVFGWSVPDVMPGALPRPPGQASPPQLEMDASGQVTAQWPSGFDAHETQVSRYTPGQGWSAAANDSVAAAPDAPVGAPASPRPASPP